MAKIPGTELAETAPVVAASRVRFELVEVAYVRHYRDVYRYALSLTRSDTDAEEIAAEVFERALRAWTSAPEPALPWLLVVARRLATDHWRRARRFARLVGGVRRPVVVAGAEERAEFWEWYSSIARVLTERQREVLALRYQRDLSDAQIGEIMGLSESGVRSLAARALDALRAHPEVL
ncbi:MAG: RNA polymerase sigma factor [Candidatus Limnocylindrales bacterium]